LIRNGSDKSGENYSRSQPTDFVNNLFEASKDGKLSSVIYLVSNGTNVNSKDYYCNKTPLYYAADNGHLSVVEYLLHQGSDFRDKIGGESYLHWAAEKGHLSVVEYLVNHEAEINAKNTSVEFLYLIGLLFIELLKKVILVLLNI